MHIRRMNRLIREKSPYLLQHAYNPVDWYPWGAEAFFRARTEGKPVFLSIGYSSCHWCHVMERESFENEQIAAILNEHFVPVKVDREERPDVDEIYITAVQLVTGSAGWPLSVFLTPDGEPFYGGTYFPPAVFADLLRQVAHLWRTQRAQVLQTAKELSDDLRALLGVRLREMRGTRDPAIFRTFLAQCMAGFDPQHGGFGDAPKFPPNAVLPVLLWMAEAWESEEAGIMALHTLNKMAEGGIHDHIGGGFHRYATDVHWLVPHFEKMLYDNAQLAWAYTRAYTLTGDPEYADVAHNTLQWMIREMRTDEGAFASALDADSPDGEGAFYTWTQDEIYGALDAETAALVCTIYNVQPEGNYREEATGRQTGRNILHRRDSLSEIAQSLGLGYEELRERLQDARTQLLEVRARRPAPARDDKVLTDWNGLAI
ncbi:MAG: thioredoxin domain-containing protein, partial [Fimbriimonadales bacterium]|nr:thioredoxin domain-containing protein [Fimbriimonadales bacterium]